MIKYILVSIVAITLLVMLGFTPASKKVENHQTKISFNKDVKSILATNCAESNCHAGTEPWMDLNLRLENSYENIVHHASKEVPGLRLILPFHPESSYLLQKIKGTRIKGGRMPYKRDPLSEKDISLVEEWIKQGAIRN